MYTWKGDIVCCLEASCWPEPKLNVENVEPLKYNKSVLKLIQKIYYRSPFNLNFFFKIN